MLLPLIGLAACAGGMGGSDDTSWLFPLWVPTDVAVADVNGDGLADVLTLAQLSTSMTDREGRLNVYLQQPGGRFAAADSYVVGTYPWRFAITDIDGDGAPDILVGDVDDHAVSWLRQDSAHRGHFLAPVRLLTGVNPYDVVAADLNGDGAVDVVATDSMQAARRVVLLPQDAASPGTFGAAQDIALPGSSVELAAGDLDGDGHADLAVVYGNSTSPTVFDNTVAVLRQSSGTLGAAQALLTRRGLNAPRLVAADYDGDGSLDLAAYLTQSSTDYTTELLAVVRPLSGAPEVIETPLAGMLGTDDAAFADLDGDGRLDAAVAGFFPRGTPSHVEAQLNVLLQDASGVLRIASQQSLPLSVSRLAAADVDGDGRADLVLLGGDDQVLLMLQDPARPGTFLTPHALP